MTINVNISSTISMTVSITITTSISITFNVNRNLNMYSSAWSKMEFVVFLLECTLNPRWPQDGAKMAAGWHQDGPKMAPRCPKRPQDSSKMAPRCFKRLQDGSKMAPRWAPRGPKKTAISTTKSTNTHGNCARARAIF